MVHITTTTDPTEAKRIAKADDMAFALKDIKELLTSDKVEQKAEDRYPYEKHMVDYNNGMHEGIIEGKEIVLEAINDILKSRNINLEDILR